VTCFSCPVPAPPQPRAATVNVRQASTPNAPPIAHGRHSTPPPHCAFFCFSSIFATHLPRRWGVGLGWRRRRRGGGEGEGSDGGGGEGGRGSEAALLAVDEGGRGGGGPGAGGEGEGCEGGAALLSDPCGGASLGSSRVISWERRTFC